MSARTRLAVRRGLALAPALALGLTAVLAQSGYAGSGAGDCFRPTLELCSQNSGPTTSVTGTASVKLKFKPPFIIQGTATAQGFLDQDSGAVGSLGASSTSRFWTPTCEGWSYGWCAKGAILGEIKSRTGSATSGSAVALNSFAAEAAGDINPRAKDAKTTQSSTSGSGGGVTISVGLAGTGPTFGVGMPVGNTTVSPSTNAAGDANVLFDGTKTSTGAGAESVVVVNLYAYVNAQANGSIGSWAPHTSKSSASTGGFAGAAVEQELYAVSTTGVGYGMGVHGQSGFWRDITRSALEAPWKRGDLRPPVDSSGGIQGPEVKNVEDPAAPPNEDDRTANGGDDRGATGGPLHKE